MRLRNLFYLIALASSPMLGQSATPTTAPRRIAGVLTPTLQSAITRVRFSPDGHLLLAQSTNDIFVLSLAPFENRLRIEAPNASDAHFTPDSKRIVFQNNAAAIEAWDATSNHRINIRPLPVDAQCKQSQLSPDGGTLACLCANATGPALDLKLIDINTGATLYSRPSYAHSVVSLEFSPDGRYLLAFTEGAPFAYDLLAHSEAHLGRAFVKLISEHFTWVAPDKVALVDAHHPDHSAIVQFPTGERLNSLPLRSNTRIIAATKGDYLLIVSKKRGEIGIYDIFEQKIVGNHDTATVDIFNNYAIAASGRNMIELFDRRYPDFAGSRIPLIGAPAKDIQLASVSPDLKYLALSTPRSSAVYRLDTGLRIGIAKPMDAPLFSGDTLYADFPKFGSDDSSNSNDIRSIGALHLLGTGSDNIVERLADDRADVRAAGTVRLIVSRTDSNSTAPLQLEARDGATNKPLWTQQFDGDPPTIETDGDCPHILLHWLASSAAARAIIAQDRHLMSQYSHLSGHAGARLLQLLDARSGATLHRLIVDAEELSSDLHLLWIGDAVAAIRPKKTDLISTTETEHKVSVEGTYSSHSVATHTVAFLHNPSELQLLDADTGTVVSSYTLPNPVRYTSFSQDGKRLFVLTEDQRYQIITLDQQLTATAH